MASGIGDIFANDLLLLILENANAALVGDATGLRGASTAGSAYISLHTSVTGLSAGDQTTNECSYTGYARKDIARAGAQWTTAAKASENTAAITFAQCTAGSSTATHFAVGTDVSGTGKILFWGALTASLAISAGITPAFGAGDLDLTMA